MRQLTHGGTERRADIQGLRAVAVLLVVAYHAGGALPGGYIGVDVFFVISGYVITRALVRQIESTGQISLGRFYLRRARRILPALGFMLGTVLVASLALAPWGGQTIAGQTGIGAALFSANIVLIRFGGSGYFDSTSNLNALLHTWSLSVEEQFYMVFPLILIAAARVGRQSRRLNERQVASQVLLAVALLGFAAAWVLTFANFGPSRVSRSLSELAFYSSATRAWEFAAGGLLVFVPSRTHRLGWQLSVALSVCGVGLLAWAAIGFNDTTPFPGHAALVPIVGTMQLIVSGEAPRRNPLVSLLATRPFLWIGDISYSWYLWHWPVIVFAGALLPGRRGVVEVAALLSIVPAAVAFELVENRFRYKANPSTGSTLALAGVSIVGPIVAGCILIAGHQGLTRTETFLDVEFATRPHADVSNGCDNKSPSPQSTEDSCTWSSSEGAAHAVLVGDSNAGQFTEGFTIGMNSAGYDATVARLANCPFVDLLIVNSNEQSAADDSVRCREFIERSLEDLLVGKPDLVVIASATDKYIEESRWELQEPGTSRSARTADAKRQMFAGALQRTIDGLEGAGIRVVVVHPVPRFPTWHPDDCAAIAWLFYGEQCGDTRSLADAQRFRQRAVDAETSAVRSTNATLVDFFAVLCESDPCTTRVAASWLYQDGFHISVLASERLAPQFEALASTNRSVSDP